MQRSMMHCGWLKTCKEHRALCRRFWRSCLPTQPIPLWELLSFSEAAKAVDPAIKMPAVPTPSQPRQGSTAPTLDLRRGTNPTHTTAPLWELSSFSEAAKAVGQAIKMPAVPPPSQPRRGSTAPTLDFCRCLNCMCRHDCNPPSKTVPTLRIQHFHHPSHRCLHPVNLRRLSAFGALAWPYPNAKPPVLNADWSPH